MPTPSPVYHFPITRNACSRARLFPPQSTGHRAARAITHSGQTRRFPSAKQHVSDSRIKPRRGRTHSRDEVLTSHEARDAELSATLLSPQWRTAEPPYPPRATRDLLLGPRGPPAVDRTPSQRPHVGSGRPEARQDTPRPPTLRSANPATRPTLSRVERGHGTAWARHSQSTPPRPPKRRAWPPEE